VSPRRQLLGADRNARLVPARPGEEGEVVVSPSQGTDELSWVRTIV
jgi:hypothetical protein